MLEHATGWTREQLLGHPERDVAPGAVSAFQQLVARRAAAEPMAYLLGQREFYGREFRVDPRALIPRPETELLVDLGKMAVSRWRGTGLEPVAVDVGTGSGAIAISVAAECSLPVIATDVSRAALSLAQENAFLHGVGVLVRLVQVDLLSGLRGPLHVILANLPYVPLQRDLPRDVRDYEPAVALFGGPCGTELIERLLQQARALLAPGAELALELDEQAQATPMAALARQLYPSADISVCRDAGGYDRVVRVVT